MLNNAALQFVDGVFLARESMESLEASLPASMLALVVTGFFQSVVAYSGTFVAQYSGAGNPEGVRKSYAAGTAIAFAAGLLAVAAIPLGLAVAPLTSSNPEVVERARSYYTIVSFGSFALCGQMAAASYFTGLGFVRIVFWTNLGGNLFNAALDPILIFGLAGAPRLGISGAAYATVAAMALQWAVLAFAASRTRRPVAAAGAAGDVPFWPLAGKILRYGIPSGAYSTLNVLSFTIFVFATARAGEIAFAASNACFKVNYLLIAPMEGFAVAAATLVGRHQGHGDSDAARRDTLKTLFLGLVLVTALSLLALVFHRPVLSMFAPEGAASEEFHSLGFTLFAIMAAWQIFDAADVIVSGALKGAGDTRFVFLWMVVSAFGFWLPLVWLVSETHPTMPALWGTMVAYVIFICGGTLLRFLRGSWRRHKLV